MTISNESTAVYVKIVPIRLGQFLKLANLVQDGFEAKIHISEGVVKVNEQIETRRGRQLAVDDIVFFDGHNYQVTLED